jgi:preprotein translocase SecE subunit
VLAVAHLVGGLGRLLENWFHGDSRTIGIALVAVVGVGLGLGAILLYFRPRFEKRLVGIEEQGWFNWQAYKRSQGQRVRRGTILGILVLAGCGIFTLNQHNTLATAQHWQIRIPYTGVAEIEKPGDSGLEPKQVLDRWEFEDTNKKLRDEGKKEATAVIRYQNLTILPDLRYTLPLLLALAAFWFAYRVVNYPTFADFLIATEAEVNKVSWTTRKRLIQDTTVVLVTVVLLTVFLFVVDQIWAVFLTKIGVLQPPPPSIGEGPKEVPW